MEKGVILKVADTRNKEMTVDFLGERKEYRFILVMRKKQRLVQLKRPQNSYELVHGPSYVVEAINVDEVLQMNGS